MERGSAQPLCFLTTKMHSQILRKAAFLPACCLYDLLGSLSGLSSLALQTFFPLGALWDHFSNNSLLLPIRLRGSGIPMIILGWCLCLSKMVCDLYPQCDISRLFKPSKSSLYMLHIPRYKDLWDEFCSKVQLWFSTPFVAFLIYSWRL